jgi:hypothetical protein
MLQYNLERPLNSAPNFTKTKEEQQIFLGFQVFEREKENKCKVAEICQNQNSEQRLIFLNFFRNSNRKVPN